MIDVSIRLRRAILRNDLLLVKRILKNSPLSLHNPDELTANTSLHLAASQPNSLPIVQHLVDTLDHEAAGVSRNNDGDTPLMVACTANNLEVVEFLGKRFPKAADWKNKMGLTGLIIAAKMGHDGIVTALLDLGPEWVDIDATDGNGNTALHYASAYGHLKTIRILIERGANPHLPNRQKWTAEQFSFSIQAEQYFKQLVSEKEKNDILQARATRAATPVFGRSEKAALPARQRASSGS
ncbi:ankyrin repeat-containing domain protein [Kalaharituber pfeilii]|nr:ankyrin repeat-containing domain protein [Kalaharituber pfeilii]